MAQKIYFLIYSYFHSLTWFIYNNFQSGVILQHCIIAMFCRHLISGSYQCFCFWTSQGSRIFCRYILLFCDTHKWSFTKQNVSNAHCLVLTLNGAETWHWHWNYFIIVGWVVELCVFNLHTTPPPSEKWSFLFWRDKNDFILSLSFNITEHRLMNVVDQITLKHMF